MKTPDIEKAVLLYYSKLEIGTSDICKLFDCSRGTGLKIKNKVRAEMAKMDKQPFLPHHVSTKIAFQVWGLDIKDLEARLKKLRRLDSGKQ